MDQILEDLDSGEIHIRDRLQFELKSEFIPLPSLKKNIYSQEFFLFIPNSLQINKQTYTKANFYQDQTSLIRYKTPEFTLKELIDVSYYPNPISKIISLGNTKFSKKSADLMHNELKLFGNIFRSSLRNRVRTLIHQIDQGNSPSLILEIKALCHEIISLQEIYDNTRASIIKKWKNPSIDTSFDYVDEFISNTINHYLTGLLDTLRLAHRSEYEEVDHALCEILVAERKSSESRLYNENDKTDKVSKEIILYRKGLLNKYVLDALLLHINRFPIDVKYQNWIGGLSAGVAMFVYFSLFLWLGNVFLINSVPFLIFTVIFYVLKDRIKEWLKFQSHQQAFKWFSDFKTEIRSPDEKKHLGVIKETFSFVDENSLPSDIKDMRNKEFNKVLETIPRPENVIYFKRTVEINELLNKASRRHDLNLIFRFNIHHFLLKASDPYESYATIDPNTLKLVNLRLPKVYHLNLIIKNTYPQSNLTSKIELEKLRLIIDKNGIKRIEQL